MTNERKRVPDTFGRLYADDTPVGGTLGTWVRRAEVDTLLDEIARLQTMESQRDHWLEIAREKDVEIERLTKRESQSMEFLRSFISGGVDQDFKPWASELYQKLYRATDEPCEQRCGCGEFCNKSMGQVYVGWCRRLADGLPVAEQHE